MALIDTKIGHKFTCKKPEQYDIMPRDASLTVVSVNHSEGVIQLGDSPFKIFVVSWNYKQNPYDFQPYVKNATDLTPVLFQYRHIESHPMCTNYGKAYEWETINRSKMDEVEAYIKDGYNYQSRTLFTGDSIAKELEDIQRYTDKVIVKERIEKLILTLKG